jgi:hypothetical protein
LQRLAYFSPQRAIYYDIFSCNFYIIIGSWYLNTCSKFFFINILEEIVRLTLGAIAVICIFSMTGLSQQADFHKQKQLQMGSGVVDMQ